MPFLTPDSQIDLVGVSLTIPRDFLHIVRGGIADATRTEDWESSGTLTPDECRNIMLRVFEGILIHEHTYLIDDDGNFIVDDDGYYLIEGDPC